MNSKEKLVRYLRYTLNIVKWNKEKDINHLVSLYRDTIHCGLKGNSDNFMSDPYFEGMIDIVKNDNIIEKEDLFISLCELLLEKYSVKETFLNKILSTLFKKEKVIIGS